MEYSLYCYHVQKLKDFCAQTGLNYHLNCGSYPITLQLKPNEWYRQTSLFDGARGANNPGSVLMKFVLIDGEITFSATEGATISDANFSKLKGLFEKISRYWTQYVFKKAAINPGETLDDLWCEAGPVTNGY